MKKISIYMFAALAAFTFFSCNKEAKTPEEEIPAPAKTGATITIKARTAETKTHIIADESGESVTYTAHWDDSGEALGLILTPGTITASDAPAELPGTKVGDEMIFSASGLDYADGTYKMFVFSPFNAYCESGDGFIVAELNAVQNPIKGSFDPKCDLLGYATDGVVIADGLATIEDIQLQRPMAILRVNIDADSEDPAFGEVVTGLKIELPETGMIPVAGKITITDEGDLDLVTPEYAVSAQIASSEAITIGAAGDAKAVYLVTFPITIPQNFPITFTVETENFNGENALTLTDNAKVNMQFESGKVNTINLTIKAGAIDARYAGGTGVEGDPWLIATPQHMLNMAEDMLSATTKLYFKLLADINMDGVEWPRINPDSPYNPIDLDGDNHTISNLTKSMFYVLNGSVKNLFLDGCEITQRGILAEYIQGEGHTVTNVKVSNCTVNYNGSNPGGLIGTINQGSGTTATISNCSVSNTDVTGKGVVGGLVGFADALVIIDGCSYSGGTVKTTARYGGGLLGSTGNYNSIITDCHVEDATIEGAVANNDYRVGGLIGQQQAKVTVKGCSVGTASKKVIISLTAPTSGKVYNAGGFAGVNYGLITQNGSVHSTAFVKITAANTATDGKLQLGGFVGYNTGSIEYSDANVDMTGIKGIYIGGFCGYNLQTGTINYCTEIGDVTGNNYTGGFLGVYDKATITNCSSEGSVSAQSTIGGFVGGCGSATATGTFENNWSTAHVTSSGSNAGGFGGTVVGTFVCNHAAGFVASSGGGNIGGFIGQIMETGEATLSRNYATGNVSGNANCGGLIGYIGGNLTMSNCYATGNVGNSTKYNQKYGGLVGFTTDSAEKSTSITITNCYASGKIEPSFAGGGLIGRIGLASCSVSKCAAWNEALTPHSIGSGNWSSGGVVGVAFPSCTLTDNYRRPGDWISAYWVPGTYDHADVSAEHKLVIRIGTEEPYTYRETTATSNASGQENYPQFPYHGHYTTISNLSQLASGTFGWSSDVWSFAGEYPSLK